VGAFQCNCSIFGDETTREAMVIDPGDELEQILEVIERHGLRVTSIVITHCHIDHIGGAAKLRARTGAPVHMNAGDLEQAAWLDRQAEWAGLPTPEMPQVDVAVRDGDRIALAGESLQVLHTPGHTRGSICLLASWDSKVFAGDTLFRDSIGRTDFPGGDGRQILLSIREKLLAQVDALVVAPGHGPLTTIGREREHNYFLRGL